MTDQIVCQVKDLSKRYLLKGKQIDVLRGCNLTIKQGDMCSVRGKSGVGKSTMLHILGALDRPSSGTVDYFGNDIFAMPEADLAAFRNKSIGFVFQFHHLLPEFTALENVALPGMIARMPRPLIMERAMELLSEVGLADRADHRPGELSGGEQQRVAIARAMVMRPRVVLADEPTGNLDQKTSDEVHELLVKINETHSVAFVVVTHNQGLADMMPRKLEMRDGVVYEGVP